MPNPSQIIVLDLGFITVSPNLKDELLASILVDSSIHILFFFFFWENWDCKNCRQYTEKLIYIESGDYISVILLSFLRGFKAVVPKEDDSRTPRGCSFQVLKLEAFQQI